MPEERYNLLYIFTDQQSGPAMSCAGNPDLDTPAMDRLAAGGVRFDRAYCTYPLCSPSRASMFSGLMPGSCGVTGNDMRFGEHVCGRELGQLLSAAGYECAYGGKWHIPEGSIPEGHGFRSICPHDDIELPEACRRFLLGRREEKPFFLVAAFDDPHNICEWARGEALPWGDLGCPPPVEKCPNLPPNFRPPAYEPELIRLEQRQSGRGYPTELWTEDDWRRYRWAYFRLVERVDEKVGLVLDALEEAGQAENTVVIFSSDHGDGQGAHGWNQKHVLYEEVVRVPFIVRAPDAGVRDAADTEHLVCSGPDMFATLCDYAGVQQVPDAPGQSLRPLLKGRPDGWRDRLVIETVLRDPRFGQGRALITGRYKYAVYSRGRNREQLFDLRTDPGEMHNLAVDARMRETLDEHRHRLAEWCRRHEPKTWTRFRVPGYEYGEDGKRV